MEPRIDLVDQAARSYGSVASLFSDVVRYIRMSPGRKRFPGLPRSGEQLARQSESEMDSQVRGLLRRPAASGMLCRKQHLWVGARSSR